MSELNETNTGINDPAAKKLLVDWEKAKKALAKLADEEMALRKAVTAEFFPAPKEGTNNYKLPNGYKLVLDSKVNRRIDRAVLDSIKDTLEGMGVNVDELVRFTPDLRVGEYKKLAGDARKLFDACVTATDGAPSLKIEEMKRQR